MIFALNLAHFYPWRQAISDNERQCFYASLDLEKSYCKSKYSFVLYNKEHLVHDISTYNSLVCDKTEDRTYRIKGQLFFAEFLFC